MVPKPEDLGDFIAASGLLEYDPAAIAGIYRNNPKRLLKRLWETLIPISLFLFGVLSDKLIGRLNDEQNKKARAKEFTELLIVLSNRSICLD